MGAGLIPVDGETDGAEIVALDADPAFADKVDDRQFIPIIDLFSHQFDLLQDMRTLGATRLAQKQIDWILDNRLVLGEAMFVHRLALNDQYESRRLRRRLPAEFRPLGVSSSESSGTPLPDHGALPLPGLDLL